jgi:hypothetical protein
MAASARACCLKAARAALLTAFLSSFSRCYGTELRSKAILCWAEKTKVDWHYIEPRKAGPECLHRELQWPLARRIFERDLVHVTDAGAPGARRMALRLQSGSAAFQHRLAGASNLRRNSHRHGAKALRSTMAPRLGPRLYPCASNCQTLAQLDESWGQGHISYAVDLELA